MLTVLMFLCGALIRGSDAQTHCCFAPQWESPINILEGYYVPATDDSGSLTALDRVAYDFINRRIAVNVSVFTNGQYIQSHLIQDFAGKKHYTFNGTACTSVNLSGEIPINCVPESAIWQGGSYFGAGNNKLHFDSWSYVQNGTNVSMVTSREDCLLIGEAITGKLGNGVSGLIAMTYTSTTVGIKDPTVFNPPTDCVHSDVVVPGMGYGGVIGR